MAVTILAACVVQVAIGFLIAAIIGAVLVRLLPKWQFRQTAYEDAPATHQKKTGTPTMGGICFVVAMLALLLYWKTPFVSAMVFLIVACAAIGFLDDFLKIRRGKNLGLQARTKFLATALIAVTFLRMIDQTYDIFPRNVLFHTATYALVVPHWLWLTIGILAITGTIHAANLTDGLDGLVAGAMIPPLTAFAAIATTAGSTIASVAACLGIGACLGFLLYNRHPAKMFMGDTGSLALGALLSGVAILTGEMLLLILIGGIFVAEGLSVILQVGYFKLSKGKRIFRMSPLHHHFELGGWPETKVTTRFLDCVRTLLAYRVRDSTMSIQFDASARLLVIGLGRAGLACADVLRARGATIFATDEKPVEHLQEAIAAITAVGAQFVLPDDVHAIVPSLSGAVLSPGIPLTNPIVRGVQDADIPVYGEIEVAYRLCKAPIIAVTGTKGKSTATALIGHLLRAGTGMKSKIFIGGNIGNPLIREAVEAQADDWVVAEISSFQLETIRAFRPRVSVILNIFADHLDRYFSLDEYAEAKFRIFANQNMQDFFVGNLDDERLARLHWKESEARVQSHQLWFTLGERHERATMYLHDDTIVYAPIGGDPRPVAIMRLDEIPLAGEHNVRNVMAACLAVLAIGYDPHELREAVKSFTPMAHRLQQVAEIDGILYVDDSKATNPGATEAALQAFDRPIVLIAGGRAKNASFETLGKAVDALAKAVVLIGEATDEIAKHIRTTPVGRAASMESAVAEARALAADGDVVLLSPGCASFDMFQSAEDRGEQFAAAVNAIAEPAGA